METNLSAIEIRHLPSIESVLADPCAHNWLKAALRSALALDPVDAANDAELLSLLLDARCAILAKQGGRA